MILTYLGTCAGRRGDSEESLVYGCSGGRAPTVTTGEGIMEAEDQATYFHEGRWPGWLGSNSTRYSSDKNFTYGEASIPCPNIEVATSRVRVTEGKRVCLTCKGDVPLGRWWWLRKLSTDIEDRSSDWERLSNDTYRTITGSPGEVTVCWEKWWAYDEGMYVCLWGSAQVCPAGLSIAFVRWWQDTGYGLEWDRSGEACVTPRIRVPINATELLAQVRKPLPTPKHTDAHGCPTTTRGPGNGLVLVPTGKLVYQGVHYAVASVVLNLTEVRLPAFCPRKTELLYQALLREMFQSFYELDFGNISVAGLYTKEGQTAQGGFERCFHWV